MDNLKSEYVLLLHKHHISIIAILLISKFSADRILDGKALTNLLRKVERGLTVLAMAPLINLEKKESRKRLEERIRRAEQKQSRRNQWRVENANHKEHKGNSRAPKQRKNRLWFSSQFRTKRLPTQTTTELPIYGSALQQKTMQQLWSGELQVDGWSLKLICVQNFSACPF